MIDENIKNWLKKANNDLKAAEVLFDSDEDEMLTDSIGFHCQQAVEKFLKAYLISCNIPFKKTHNLELLLELCKNQDKNFENINVGDLSNFAVEIRYPDDFFELNADDMKNYLEIVVYVKEFVEERL